MPELQKITGNYYYDDPLAAVMVLQENVGNVVSDITSELQNLQEGAGKPHPLVGGDESDLARNN